MEELSCRGRRCVGLASRADAAGGSEIINESCHQGFQCSWREFNAGPHSHGRRWSGLAGHCEMLLLYMHMNSKNRNNSRDSDHGREAEP